MKALLLAGIFICSHAFSETYVVEFKKSLSSKTLKKIEIASKGKVESFSSDKSDYFK